MHTDHMSRRRFLAGTIAGLATAGALPTVLPQPASARPARPLPSGLFKLGVASGDPRPDGVVLWTRLAPEPLSEAPGAGMPPQPVPVHWQVATDESFRRVVRRGTITARPGSGHSVHADVRGLSPERWYWYRFRAGREVSPIGRTRTAPAAGAKVDHLRFAFASCQQWRDGFYTPHSHLAEEDLDLVVFLGDYIYESRPSGGPRPDVVAPHLDPEPFTVDEYRRRYALYRLDPDLQAAHARFPWVVTLDDHEVDNNWADEIPQDPDVQSPEQFLARRAAAFQAFYEHLPLPDKARPSGIDMRVFRRLDWGQLARFHVLDSRQYRSDQITTIEASRDPSRTMLGREQERWLFHGLDHSPARWNVLANQVFMAENDRIQGTFDFFDLDNWDGYAYSRQRLLQFLHERRPSNPFVITGDRHATWVCDLTTDFADPAAPVVGSEIVGTSISSGGDPIPGLFDAIFGPIKAESPHWKYLSDGRGYVRCRIDKAECRSDLRIVSTVRSPEATIATQASFVVENGRPGIQVA